MRGRRPSRRAVIAAAIALAVVLGAGAAALVAASGDDDGTRAPVASATSSTTRSSSDPRTSSTEGSSSTATATSTESESESETATQTSSAPDASPAEPPSTVGDSGAKHRVVKVPPARVFSGKGTTWLGTVELSKPALVAWSGQGKLSIRFGRERFPVVAPSHSGQLAVPPYRFELVRVISNGSWQIKVTPQG